MSDYKELTILPVRKQPEEEDDLNEIIENITKNY